jgi:BlaI family penicillinase repressor
VLVSLWNLGTASVPQVIEEFADRFEYEYAYSTILTVLRRLVARGWVARGKVGKAHRYKPLLAREKVQRCALERMSWSLFGGAKWLMIEMLEGMQSPRSRRLE